MSTKKQGNPLINYFKASYAEMRKVTWPSREETCQKAWIVIGFTVGFMVILGALDFVFSQAIEVLI